MTIQIVKAVNIIGQEVNARFLDHGDRSVKVQDRAVQWDLLIDGVPVRYSHNFSTNLLIGSCWEPVDAEVVEFLKNI